MCTGHVHALSGLAAGAALGLYALHLTPPGTAELAGLTAAFATLPDLDSRGSCAGRSLGFVSAAVAIVVRTVSGGHRHFTHTALGAGAFAALAWLAGYFRHDTAGRWALAFFLALAFASGLRALRFHSHGADVLALAAAGVMAWTGLGLALVPLACGLGALTHIAGDACTDEGVPFCWPLLRGHQFLLPRPLRFTTDHAAERFLVSPALVLVLAFLALHVATSGDAFTHTAQFHHTTTVERNRHVRTPR